MTPVEVAAVAFSLLSVWLTIRKRISCWPVGIVGVLAYMVLFARVRLYADLGLQVVYLAQGVYGWVLWARGAGRDEQGGGVARLAARGAALTVLSVAVGAAGLGWVLARTTDASLPYLDSLLAALSLAANYLLARKALENWALWIVADVLYVGMFAYKGLLLSAALYALFLVLAVLGLRRWQKEMRAATAAPW